MPADEGDGDVTVLFYLCNGFVCTCMSVSVSVSDFYTIDTMPKFREICKYGRRKFICKITNSGNKLTAGKRVPPIVGCDIFTAVLLLFQ